MRRGWGRVLRLLVEPILIVIGLGWHQELALDSRLHPELALAMGFLMESEPAYRSVLVLVNRSVSGYQLKLGLEYCGHLISTVSGLATRLTPVLRQESGLQSPLEYCGHLISTVSGLS